MEPTICKTPTIYDTGAGGGLPDGYVTIEGEKYPYKKIGGRIWTIENFRNINHLSFNTNYDSSDTTAYVYPIGTSGNTTSGNFSGFLYNFAAVKTIIAQYNLNGFRIPNVADFENLKNIENKFLKSFRTWQNEMGTDDTLFCAIATGYANAGQLKNLGKTTDFWAADENDDNTKMATNYWFGLDQQYIVKETNGYLNGFCLRLCKDL